MRKKRPCPFFFFFYMYSSYFFDLVCITLCARALLCRPFICSGNNAEMGEERGSVVKWVWKIEADFFFKVTELPFRHANIYTYNINTRLHTNGHPYLQGSVNTHHYIPQLWLSVHTHAKQPLCKEVYLHIFLKCVSVLKLICMAAFGICKY
ncbi:hypothetical protein MHYP_G00010890 [Metynnis hypsauchen]